jgi:hypothetical protein
MSFCTLYNNAREYVQQNIDEYAREDINLLIRNFKFITGLIVLNIFRRRVSKCILCQFSKREIYKKLEEIMSIAVKDRSDVLPEEFLEDIEKFSELAVFNGFDVERDEVDKEIAKKMLRYADLYKKDLDFQIMVSLRRKDLRLKQKLAMEEEHTE